MDRFNIDKMRNALDEAKSAVKARIGTEAERKIEEALSNKNWGASSTLLNEIAQLTYDYEEYNLIMRKIWESLDSNGRQWRTVFKGLTLLDHLIKNGTERVVENARDHMFKLRTLSDFTYYDGTSDKGAGVREKSKQLLDMLNDNEKIREEREKARRLRDKYVGIGSNRGTFGSSGMDSYSGGGDSYSGGGSYDSGDRDRYGGGDRERYSGDRDRSRYGERTSYRDEHSKSSSSRRYGDDTSDDDSYRKDRERRDRVRDQDDSDGSGEENARSSRRDSKRRDSKKKSSGRTSERASERASEKKSSSANASKASSNTPSNAPSLLDDFGSPLASSGASSTPFDPFSMHSTPQVPQQQPFEPFSYSQPQQPQQQASFDPFGNSQSSQASAGPFTTNSQTLAPPAPTHFGGMVGGADQFGDFASAGVPQQQFAPQQFPPQQQQVQQQAMAMRLSNRQGPPQQQYMNQSGVSVTNQMPQQSQQYSGHSMGSGPEFGEFQSEPAKPKSNDAWGVGSDLFDLSNLKKSSPSPASNVNSTGPMGGTMRHDSFSGLDTLAGMPSKPGASGMGLSSMGGPGMQRSSISGGMPVMGMGMGMGGMHSMGGMPMGMQQPGMGGMQQPGVGGMQQPGMGGMGGMPQPGMGSMQQPGMGGMQQSGMGGMGMSVGGGMGMPQGGMQGGSGGMARGMPGMSGMQGGSGMNMMPQQGMGMQNQQQQFAYGQRF